MKRRSRILIAAAVAAACLAGIGLGGYLLGSHASDADPSAGAEHAHADGAAATTWTCSMHPQIQMEQPGLCPICNMDLIPLAGDDGEDAGPRTLRLSPAGAALADIRTVPATRRYVDRQVRLAGTVAYDERLVESISAWVGGRIDRLYVDYTGVPVAEGEHLFELYAPELITAQQELLQARRLVAGEAEEDAFLARSSDQALTAAREKLRLLGLDAEQVAAIEEAGAVRNRVTIRAPAGGVVVGKHVKEGDYVEAGSPVVTIADLSQVWLELEAYEIDLPALRYGQQVRIRAEALPGETLDGRIVFLHPELDTRTRTVRVRVNVPNPERRLRPGMFVRAEVLVQLGAGGAVVGDPDLAGKWIGRMHPSVIRDAPGTCPVCGMELVPAEELGLVDAQLPPPPLVVPAAAVLPTGERAVVYVRRPGDEPVFQGREVVLGPRAGEHYIIASGLEAGEQVVVSGNFKLDAELQIKARPSMMSPATTVTLSGGVGMDDPLARARSARRARLQVEATPAMLAALDPVHAAYRTLQEALAGDEFERAQNAYAGLGQAIDGVDATALTGEAGALWASVAATLRAAIARGRAAPDIATARRVFADVSAAMIDLVRGMGSPADAPLHIAYCPMAFDDRGASWIQDDQEIANPYFGSSMLRCGVIELRVPAAPAGVEGE